MRGILDMVWHDLCFLHWPVSSQWLRPHIPEGLAVDEYQGQAWLALVPFTMSGVKPPPFPHVPGLTAFPEFNVRTYVRDQEVSGVWFFSLDAAQWLAVRVARRFFHLPYFDARFQREWQQGWCHYEVERTHRGAAPLHFRGRYRPLGEVFHSQPGSLEEWLTERYWLFSQDPRGRLWRGRVAHRRWPLQQAQAELEIRPLGLPLEGPPASQLFAGLLRVSADSIEPARALSPVPQ